MKNRNYLLASLLIMIMAGVSYNFFDITVATYFQHLKSSPLSHYFSILTELGKAEYTLVPAGLLYLYYKNRDRKIALKGGFVFVSIALSGILVNLIKVIAGRFRPERYFKDDAFGFDFFHISHDMTSFPSGHSATALGAAAAMAILFPRFAVWFYLLGIAIMSSRVVIVRHYPSDILVGGLIGALTSYLLYERVFKKRIADAA